MKFLSLRFQTVYLYQFLAQLMSSLSLMYIISVFQSYNSCYGKTPVWSSRLGAREYCHSGNQTHSLLALCNLEWKLLEKLIFSKQYMFHTVFTSKYKESATARVYMRLCIYIF